MSVGISPVSITTSSPLPNCSTGIAFSYTLNAVGGISPYTWTVSSGSVQPGLSLSSAGVLSGTCTNSSGTATFTVQACDSEGTPQCNLATLQQTAQSPSQTLVVCDSSSSPTCANPPSTGVTGTYLQYFFNANGGQAPYTWAITSGSIPTGTTLATSGGLTGFPSAAGAFPFTIQVTDSETPTPATASASFTITITGSTGNPQTALEPQEWVTAHQGGVNSSTGNPCDITDTNCTWNLPKTCNAANHCVHEQLGFGSNDYPATLVGLYDAGCDWAVNLDRKSVV